MYNYCLLHSQPHLQKTRWNALRDSIDFIINNHDFYILAIKHFQNTPEKCAIRWRR